MWSAVLFAHFFKRRLRVDDFFNLSGARTIENFRLNGWIHMIAAFFSPKAERILNHWVRDFFVSLTQNYIDRRLAADELRKRRHHDRIAELGAHLRGFFQHF